MDIEEKTYYQILGLSHDVSTVEIKRAYRLLVKTQHPDLDHRNKSQEEIQTATEYMLQLNEAYETLMDKRRRIQYDMMIGLPVKSRPDKTFRFKKSNEDEQREIFLTKVFYPSRMAIAKVLSMYGKQIILLSQDPFDDELMANFESYVDQIEAALRKSSDAFSKSVVPSTLEPAVHMMRHCIAQAADGLEELRYYCQNYDYDHLTMAENLFVIAKDLSRESLGLTKSL